jgi:hypothetical protein
MHFVCEKDVVFSDTVKAKMASCKAFYKEAMFEGDTAALVEMRPAGITLKKIIDRNDFRRLRKFFENDPSVNDSILNAMSVYDLEWKMMEVIGKCKLTSFDKQLYLLAKEDGLSLNGLEDPKDVYRKKDRLSLSEQAIYVNGLLTNIDKIAMRMRIEIGFYYSGNIDKLYQLYAFDRGVKSNYAIDVGDKRNRNWMPVIEKAIREGPTFFAFGCMHLPSGTGIINLLREKGYTLKPLFYY